jgi:hypothetical protein
MESARPAWATPLIDAHELHGEAIDASTGNVWQSLEPISRDDDRELRLAPGWLRVGIGRAAMDEHWFTRSPGREEHGPMEQLVLGASARTWRGQSLT